MAIAPNNRIPAIVDHAPVDGGKPISIFESGAILLYLADKTGKFIGKDLRTRNEVIQWLFWQMGGLGPMAGQNNHFSTYAPEKIPYAIDRYRNEVNRLYGVMNKRLADRDYLGGEYSDRRHGLLSVGGSLGTPGTEHRRLPAPRALARRRSRRGPPWSRPMNGRRRSIRARAAFVRAEERAILFGQTAKVDRSAAARQTPLVLCRTMTGVPTATRSYRSITSSLTRRKQPEETAWPIVSGALVPWMR